MKQTRLSRLLELIGLLQAGKGRNVSSLAAGCQVTRRTIFRDLAILRQSGVPILFDEEFQAYHLDGSYLLPPTNFSGSEALAVLVLCSEVGSRLKWNPDGILDFAVTVSGLNEISWWILGYGDQAAVVEPPELRKLIVKHARRIMRQYHTTGSQTPKS